MIPKTRTEWWFAKLKSNRARHEKNRLLLKQLGWQVITIWECEIDPAKLEVLTVKINSFGSPAPSLP